MFSLIAQKIAAYVLARLKEPSTWRGIVVAITGAGVYMSPKLQTVIIAVGAALFTALSATPDKIGGGNGMGSGSGGTGTGTTTTSESSGTTTGPSAIEGAKG